MLLQIYRIYMEKRLFGGWGLCTFSTTWKAGERGEMAKGRLGTGNMAESVMADVAVARRMWLGDETEEWYMAGLGGSGWDRGGG